MEPVLSQVSAWSYAFAATLHALFGLYLGMAWRRGRRGAFLLGVVMASAVWAGANWAFSLSGWVWLFQLGNLLDVLRMAAWFGFLIAMLYQSADGHRDEDLPGWPRPGALAVVSCAAVGVACFNIGLPLYGTPLRT